MFMMEIKMFDISGKKAVIVGSAGGFGKAIAIGYAANGCDVIISSRKEPALIEACKEISEKAAPGVQVKYYVCDATDEQSVIEFQEHVVSPEGLGGCDILVCAQGYNKKMFSWEIDLDIWKGMLDTNITSVMLCCKYFGNWMKENNLEGTQKAASSEYESGKPSPDQGYGKIITFGSVRSIRAVANGGNGNVPYNTTKGAVEMLTKAFASDLRPNIQVNSIGPTITYTPMMVGILPDDEKARDEKAKSMPAQRIGREIDVVGPAIFLASAASDFITGSTIYPDGGLTAVG
mgnify:FL=1